MRVSYLGIAFLLLGLVVIGTAYAGYPLSVVVVSTPSSSYAFTVNSDVSAIYHSSNGTLHAIDALASPPTESNPWLFGQFYNNTKPLSVPIDVGYYAYVRGLNYTYSAFNSLLNVSGSGVSKYANPASGTIDVTLTITNESSGQTTQHTVPVSISISISKLVHGIRKYGSNGLPLPANEWSYTVSYYGIIQGSGAFTFNDPYSIYTNSAVYAFSFSSGSGTISAGNTSYTITLDPSPTVYGEFVTLSSSPPNSNPPNSSPPNSNSISPGNFWVGTSLNSMTKIVSTNQTLNLHVTSFPAPLYVVFVFNGSIPKNYINVYYTYSIYDNSTTPTSSGTVNFADKSTTSVTINGQSYSYAFISILNISGPSKIVLLGNYATSEYSSIPLMEIGGFSDNAPVQSAFSTQQYISFGIGAVLILIGAVWIFKK